MSENSANAQRGAWSSSLIFVLAAAGSAIGLGNIWKFPYITHEYGGGAFVIVYLVCILFIGLPIMWCEIYIGKKTQLSPVRAFQQLSKGSRAWPLIGGLGVLTGFTILSFYTVVAGWVMHYVRISATGALHGMSSEAIGGYMGSFFADPVAQVGYHFAIIVITAGFVFAGVKKGIGRAAEILMPILFVMLVGLMFYSMGTRAGGEAVKFLFDPSNFKNLSAEGVLVALGHAFFTLSLGMGAMITYGSYLHEKENIVPSGMAIVALDTVIAFLACLVIYPILFSFETEVGSGPGLIFITMPHLFDQMPGGTILAIVFFSLVLFAALTSAISLMEVVVAYLIDHEKLRMDRPKATILSATLIFLLGVPSALSFGKLSDATLGGKTFFDWMDYLSSSWMLPIGGLFTALFVGWVANQEEVKEEISGTWPHLYPIWLNVTRYVAPVLVALVLLHTTGVFGKLFD